MPGPDTRSRLCPVATAILATWVLALLSWSCGPGKLVISAARPGDGWTMFGGDPGRTNDAPGPVAPPLAMEWEYDAGSGFGPASAAVSDSTVFVGTLTGEVRAVDLATGRETGGHDFGAAIFGTPLVIGTRIVVGLSGEKENIVCYNLRTGSVDWSTGSPRVESSLLLAGGRIVAAGLDGSATAYDTAKGAELWRYELPQSPGRPGIRSSPSGDAGHVVFGTDGGEVVAVDPATGKLIWKAVAGGAVFAPTSIADGRVFACSLDGKLCAIDEATGSLLWTFDAGAPLYGAAAAGPGMVVAGTSAGEVVSLRPSDGSLLWRTPTEGGIGSAPLICGGFVYVGDLRNNLYAFDARTGGEVWSKKIAGRIRATPVAVSGRLVVLAEDRSVIAFGEER